MNLSKSHLIRRLGMATALMGCAVAFGWQLNQAAQATGAQEDADPATVPLTDQAAGGRGRVPDAPEQDYLGRCGP